MALAARGESQPRQWGLREHLDRDPELVHKRFPELDFGSTVARRLLLSGGTILPVAAEFGQMEVARLLLDRGADLSVRVKLPGHYERPDEMMECTPLGYALRFPGREGLTVALLRERGAES